MKLSEGDWSYRVGTRFDFVDQRQAKFGAMLHDLGKVEPVVVVMRYVTGLNADLMIVRSQVEMNG